MKLRESGMPPEKIWESFFIPEDCLRSMGIDNKTKNFLDIGCGYGTFLLPAAKIISGRAIGIDIDNQLLSDIKEKAINQGIVNIELMSEDISNQNSSEIKDKYLTKIDFIAMFNILHCEQPVQLMESVVRLLSPNGRVGVTHWKYEPTPRGPSMEIRPKQEQIIKWASEAGLVLIQELDLPPYHYGLVFTKGCSN
jgi:ubiquinone/menaquinone biosynthesis C-methylase UbiE